MVINMNKSLERAWYILRTYIVYMVVKTFSLYLLAMIIPSIIGLFINNASLVVEQNKNLFSALVNALASIIGAICILKDFAATLRPVDVFKKDFKASDTLATSFFEGLNNIPNKLIPLGCVMSIGITTSIALNVLVSLLEVQSGRYDVVEKIQYSVPLWLGIILYGVVSPVVEEIVFRGVTYNRIKGFFGVGIGIILNSLLFGMFHANLPQFIYATVMGIIITICYEWTGTFVAALVMHGSANIFVYVFSNCCEGVNINTWGVFGVFTALSAVLIILLYYVKKRLLK